MARRTLWTRASVSVALVGLSLLTAACSTGPEESTRDGGPGTRAPRAAPSPTGVTITLPMDRYRLQGSDLKTVEAAVAQATGTCMKRLGLTYRPPQSEPSEWGAEENRRYGIQDPARAASYGYRPVSVVHPPEDSKTVYSDAVVAALTGRDQQGKALPQGAEAPSGDPIPSGGCRGEADRTVRVPYDYAKGVAAARTVDFHGFEKSLNEPSVKKAFAEWSACMKAKGYEYATPLAAMGSAEFAKGPVSDHERAVAQRDVVCKEKVDLIRRWDEAESAVQRRLIKKNQAVLDRFLELQRAKVAAARKLLDADD